MSDHSVISWTKQLYFPKQNTDHKSPEAAGSSHVTKYILNDIPPSFLNCEESLELVMSTIDKIENNLFRKHDVTKAYQNFIDLMNSEMDSKLKRKVLPLESFSSINQEQKHTGTQNYKKCGIVLVLLNNSGLSLKVQP